VSVQIGDEAPDFELKDQTNQPVRLSDYRGKKHVVSSSTRCRSPGCARARCAGSATRSTFRNDEVETLAISVDAPPTHARWAHEQGFEFPLLSDFWPHGEVASTYGVFDDRSVWRCAAPSSSTRTAGGLHRPQPDPRGA
jgi:mycoredoxin-dependent peroxiredoxin